MHLADRSLVRCVESGDLKVKFQPSCVEKQVSRNVQ